MNDISVKKTRVALVTNMPTPYRQKVFEILSKSPDVDFCVFFCTEKEPNRLWDLGVDGYASKYLKQRYFNFFGRYVHFNPDIYSALSSFNPDVVVTTGFNPTHLIAFFYAKMNKLAHIPMTDGTLVSEKVLSFFHRLARRVVYSQSQAFVGASDGSLALYLSYGIAKDYFFKSHLCVDNARFLSKFNSLKKYDFLFSGRFVQIKNPIFALRVASMVATRLGRKVSIAYLGAGELEGEIKIKANDLAGVVDVVFLGFARQADLPDLYASAKILLFPSSFEPWGLVANEACATGTPVIISDVAGAANELVKNNINGYVVPLDLNLWAKAAEELLVNDIKYSEMSRRALSSVVDYNFANAASGIEKAVLYARTHLLNKNKDFSSPRVLVIQRRMTHYRVELFNQMKDNLASLGVVLDVAYGDPTPEEAKKGDAADLPWGIKLKSIYFPPKNFCWQNIRKYTSGAQLVVIPQENKMLYNYIEIFFPGRHKVAYWGHGKNFQSKNSQSLSERLKSWLLKKVDWWFAYTSISAKVVADTGFSSEKITVLENSIDTVSLARELAQIDSHEVVRYLSDLQIVQGKVGLYIGSLYEDKRIEFLIQAAFEIKKEVPEFSLIVAGDGPLRGVVEDAARKCGGWIHLVGVRKDQEKALILRSSTLMLNPGMVGLSILDSIFAEVPMVTTDADNHSPEISYLRDGVNGVVTSDSLNSYVSGVVKLINNPEHINRLREGCRISSKDISIENMCTNFCGGIVACLR